MQEVFNATLIWVISHLALATDPVRRALVSVLGARLFTAGYSIVALLTLANLIWVYTDVPRFDYLWTPNPDLYWFAKLSMPLACVFLFGGFMVKNPTMVGASFTQNLDASDPAKNREGMAKNTDIAKSTDMAKGVTRITRHPFQWAVIIWSTGHIAANGDWVSIIFFSSFLLVSSIGSWLMDLKQAAKQGADWQRYALVTSNMPFLAILQRRNRLVWSELGWPVAVGIVGYGLLYYFHEALTGAIVG